MKRSPDVVIIGSGTTAFAAALRASGHGARVLMVEQSRLGGTCVNWGCIPSKTLIHHAQNYFEARRGAPFGLNLQAEGADCRRLMEAKKAAVETVRREHYEQVLERHREITIRRGHGRFLSARELQVGAEVLVADHFLVAAGGTPRILPLPGLSETGYLTSYSALHLPCFPESLIIIGGGVIALEMGQMFARFGSRVTIIERGDRILKDFDHRLTDIFQDVLRGEGIRLVLGAQARRACRREEGSALVVEVDGEEATFEAERIMLAVGTAPATEDIGLEAAGVEVDGGGYIVADRQMRTTAAGIWAAGDVTGAPLIAPAGAAEGEIAVDNMLGVAGEASIDHRQTPMGVFVDPEFASVGLTSKQARQEGQEVAETFLDLEHVAKAHVMGGRRGGIVLVADHGSGRILGAQILAPRAADVIHEAALAVRFGLTCADLAETVHVYPSISDGLRLAALQWLAAQRPS